MNGNICGYWYKDGYIRTSWKEFSLKNINNKYIHLTNDAIQKRSEQYGKFEDNNKLSYKEFQKHFDFVHPEWKIDFEGKIYPQMKKLANDTIKATYVQIDPHRRHHSFELFGYDFMVDESQKVWLIEVNTNPCLELASNYLTRLIPSLIENTVKIAIDPKNQVILSRWWCLLKITCLPCSIPHLQIKREIGPWRRLHIAGWSCDRGNSWRCPSSVLR